MKNKLLPIGTIVTHKDKTDTHLMIVTYIEKNKPIDGKNYDYACCIYPFGVGKDTILISKDDIDKVVFIGYQNGEFLKFKEIYEGEQNA